TTLGRFDLYFGTQDNNLWASGDDGATWINPVGHEGFYIEQQHRVAAAADSKTTFTACSPCVNFVADPLFTNVAVWPDVTTPPTGNPKIVRGSSRVQGVDPTGAGAFTKGLAVTTNVGSSWAQYANIPQDRKDIPKLSDPGLVPVLYHSIRTGFDPARNFDIDTLARVVEKLSAPGASVSFPLMKNCGGLGINLTNLVWYQVFGVDPGYTQH